MQLGPLYGNNYEPSVVPLTQQRKHSEPKSGEKTSKYDWVKFNEESKRDVLMKFKTEMNNWMRINS